MKRILAFDPGWSTGVVTAELPEDEPLRIVHGWQFLGGVETLIEWLEEETWTDMTIISEKFTPRPTPGFSLTPRAVEPLRCEGALIAYGAMPADEKAPVWRSPDQQYIFGGNNLKARKSLAREFLKYAGMYRTGSELRWDGAPDNNDYVSAACHVLSYTVKVLHHKPTWDLLTGWKGE